MTTNPTEPKIRIAAVYFDVPTVWVDQFETTDRRGERVIVQEWTGAIDHDGNVMDSNRYATGLESTTTARIATASSVISTCRSPPTSRRQWTHSAPSDQAKRGCMNSFHAR